jgi:hypothetical protein
MTRFAYERVKDRELMAGIFIVSRDLSVGSALAEPQLVIECSLQGEWDGLVVFVPL